MEGNDLTGGNIAVHTGSDILVQGNTLRGFSGADAAIVVRGSRVERDGLGQHGQWIGDGDLGDRGRRGDGRGQHPTDNRVGVMAATPNAVVDRNAIRGSATGVSVSGGAVTGNTIEGNQVGLSIVGRAPVTITADTFCGNDVNVRRSGEESVSLDGNEICAEAASPDPAG